MDWKTVDWMHGLTTLYTEGAATYLSKKIVPGSERIDVFHI